MTAYSDYLRPDLIVYEEHLRGPKAMTGSELVTMKFQGDLEKCADFYETNGRRIIVHLDTANPLRIGRLVGNLQFAAGQEIPRSDIRPLFPTTAVQTIGQLRRMISIAPQKSADATQRAMHDLDAIMRRNL